MGTEGNAQATPEAVNRSKHGWDVFVKGATISTIASALVLAFVVLLITR